ncbi:hypothetical protein [Actinoplanes siamensis]|uniref:Uncharacterized protein n=1 Tax=Actinoplanes siamensis TaxID=1223317 RepID=A0A919TL71_9ACTN|nr:hypothetical protein [Actinoplanes siamensis]GIF06831.1 hypothetical protein Asi03nite_43690 [Actinoplanes siamensis]
MPEKELTAAQLATILALMAMGGTSPRAFLADTKKVGLEKGKRDDLVNRKLITVTGKPMVLELTDDGWGRAKQELGKEAPPRSGALGGAFYLHLEALRGFLERNDLSAAEFYAPGIVSRPAETTKIDIEGQIRAVYHDIAARRGDYVMLEDLRGALPGGTASGQVDAALLRLDKAPDVHLVPESNQKILTPGQRAAAIRIGNQDMHLLAIRD